MIITVKIEGMHCGMCEAHINDIIRNTFKVKKVRSSKRKGQSIIWTDNDVDDAELARSIKNAGYEVISISRE